MFCGKCGTKNPDDAKFCVKCGEKLSRVETEKVEATIVTEKNNKNRKVGIIAVVALTVIAIVIANSILGRINYQFKERSYEATFDKYFNATLDADAETIFELIPEQMIMNLVHKKGYGLNVMIDKMNEKLRENYEAVEAYYGKDWEMTYKILNVEDVEGYDLDNLKKYYKNNYVDVTSAKILNIQVTFEASTYKDSNMTDITVIKVGRSWYLDYRTLELDL